MRPFTEKFADPSTLGHDQAVEPKKMALDKAPKLRKTRDLTDSLVGGFSRAADFNCGCVDLESFQKTDNRVQVQTNCIRVHRGAVRPLLFLVCKAVLMCTKGGELPLVEGSGWGLACFCWQRGVFTLRGIVT